MAERCVISARISPEVKAQIDKERDLLGFSYGQWIEFSVQCAAARRQLLREQHARLLQLATVQFAEVSPWPPMP